MGADKTDNKSNESDAIQIALDDSPVAAIAQDKRRAPRAQIEIPLQIRLPRMEDALSSEVVNMSRSGMFIAMATPLSVGSQFDIKIELKEGQILLKARVKVVRQQLDREPIGVGVQYLSVYYEDEGFVERLIADERNFGKFKLDALIGKGGMAEVFRAHILEGEDIGKTVAIKRLLPDLAKDPIYVDLFVSEADVSRMLKYKSIIEVYETGAVGDTYYIAMEYIKGGNLSQLLYLAEQKKKYLPIELCCYIAHEVAKALDYAHKACAPDGAHYRLVHCDVTPSNVFISYEGDIKLADFGVVQIGAIAPSAEEKVMAGKAAYLSPEQILGEPISAATDIFSLGAVLYEMLSNQPAFRGKNNRDMWNKILTAKYPRITSLRKEISKPLENVINRALSPHLENARGTLDSVLRTSLLKKKVFRFTEAKVLAEELEKFYDPIFDGQKVMANFINKLMNS